MRYILFPFKLLLYLTVCGIYFMGSMRQPFPRWNNMYGSLDRDRNRNSARDTKRRKAVLQIQSVGGYWTDQYELMSDERAVRSALLDGLSRSNAFPPRTRVVDKQTGAVLDMLQG